MAHEASPGSALILNVNDSEGARYMVSRLLKRAGFRVLDATTGHEALALIEREKPALVVLDIKLPDIDGFQVCRRIREHPQASRDPEILEFDHRGNKVASVARLAWSEVALEKLSAEMAKCEVRCVNCHRRRTAQERGHYRYVALSTPL